MRTTTQRFAAEGRLAVFVGAGVSSIPPTCLPSWWAVNRSVVTALRDRAAELVGPDRADALAHSITARQEGNKFPPEYQAEVIVRRLRESYFKVLQCLDSATPNSVHLGIASLAQAGRVPAIVTTNFDRALEAAFREIDVPFEVCSRPAQFQALAARLAQPGEAGRACPILKLHGSAEDPATLIDTLSQRKRGFPTEVAACLRHLLREAHWLFLGYSGADLLAEENYLFLKPDAAQAQGFTWLLRTKEEPVTALTVTRDAYRGRSEIIHGELPDWLAEFSKPLLPASFPRTPPQSEDAVNEIRRTAAATVARHATEWAQAERFDRIVIAFADLLEAVGEPAASLELLQQLYNTRPADERRSGHFGIVIDALANRYSQASEFDRASALFREALDIYDPVADEEQHLGALSNLALVYDRQGRTTEALDIYERVLRFAEKSGSPASRGVALHNLAMIRHRLGQDEEAERLYREELEVVQALGDEHGRAFALNNLGELEVSRRRFDRAVDYLTQAVKIRDRIGDDLGAANSRGNLANAHLLQREHEPALRLFDECLEVFRRFGNRVAVARTLANIAVVKEQTGKRDEAVALIDKVLEEADATRSDPVRAQALQLLGEIQQKQGNHQASANTYRDLIDLTVKICDAKGERDARVGSGIALKELGDFEEAIKELRQALVLTDRHQFPGSEWGLEHLADALNREGVALQTRGELERSLTSLREAVNIWRQRGSLYNEGQTLINVANTLAASKRYDDAAETLDQAAAAILQSHKPEEADDVAFRAGDVYLQLGRVDKASEAFRAIVRRATSYEERAARMNRLGMLASKHLERGAIQWGLWILDECVRWNQEDGYPPDAAACMLNIGNVLNATGNVAEACEYFDEAIAILEREQHPMLALARELRASAI